MPLPAPPPAPGGTSGLQLDAESRAWWVRLHSAESVRLSAIAELHERLRREARFQIHWRTRTLSEFPRSDLDDLAVQAADDALLALLRKLDDYRGDSQFWTWARRFAQLEAPASIRRRLGRDHLAPGDPDRELAFPEPGPSPGEQVEARELLRTVGDVIATQLSRRQRIVLVAIAINGVSTDILAAELHTTRGAIYKTLHDARAKLNAQLALC